jgi:hypothetical protein
MIGGIDVIPALASTFAEITFIDTSAFMNALHRQRLYFSNEGKFKKLKTETEDGEPVDDLLRSNIGFMRQRIESLINEARMGLAPYNELMQESPETAPSEPAEPASALDDVH